MRKSTEQRMVLTVGEKITRVNIIDGGKALEIVFSVSESEEKKSEIVETNVEIQEFEEKKSETLEANVISQEFEEIFPIVDIENVSLEDRFMQYEPENDLAKRVKKSIIEAKRIGMKNFRIPAMDLSLDDDGKTIVYCAGRKPAVGKSAKWWNENAPKFMPNKNSRMRDDLEHDVVLGVMQIRYLVEEKGYKVKDAWEAVCVDSRELGHYFNSKNAKRKFETTGSRQIGKCFDLGNTCKIVKEHRTSGFLLFSGRYDKYSFNCPLAHAESVTNSEFNFFGSVGELVLDV